MYIKLIKKNYNKRKKGVTDVFKVKDLSPEKKCKKGHKYPKEYDKECDYCIAQFGYKHES